VTTDPAAVASPPATPRRADERRLADLTAGNRATEQRLRVGFPDVAKLSLQVQALRVLVIGDDPARQLAYDIAYQEAVAGALAAVEAQLPAARLTAAPPGLVVPRS
jgi:hypothetical protein